MTDEMQPQDQQPAVKADIYRVEASMSAINADMTGMKADMTGMKADISDLKADVASIKTDVREMKDMFMKMGVTLAHHTAELSDIRGYIKTNLVTRDEFHSRMDGFTGRVLDQDYSTTKNRLRLDEHEARIRALEDKRA